MARTRRLTPYETQRLTQFLFDGFSDAEVAFYFNLSPNRVGNIRRGLEHPEIRRNLMDKKAIYIEMVRDGTSKGWARICWFLERRWPKEFARPEVQLQLGEHVTTNNTLVVSAELADALIKRSKLIEHEVDKLLNDRQSNSPSDMSSEKLPSEEL